MDKPRFNSAKFEQLRHLVAVVKLIMLNILRLPGTYAAKIDKSDPPLHVSLNNFVIIEGNVQWGSDFHLL